MNRDDSLERCFGTPPALVPVCHTGVISHSWNHRLLPTPCSRVCEKSARERVCECERKRECKRGCQLVRGSARVNVKVRFCVC